MFSIKSISIGDNLRGARLGRLDLTARTGAESGTGLERRSHEWTAQPVATSLAGIDLIEIIHFLLRATLPNVGAKERP